MALVSNPLSDQTTLQCCSGKKIKKITYSCGPNGTETILVCFQHYQLDEFNNKASIIVEVDI